MNPKSQGTHAGFGSFATSKMARTPRMSNTAMAAIVNQTAKSTSNGGFRPFFRDLTMAPFCLS